MPQTAEHDRLSKDGLNWKRWGPYLSERQWGTDINIETGISGGINNVV